MRKVVGMMLLLLLPLMAAPALAQTETDGEDILTEDQLKFYDPLKWRGHNHIEGFVGGSNFAGTTGSTFGLGYSYRFTRWVSVGLNYQNTGGAINADLIVPALYFHTPGAGRVLLAPAYISSDNVNDDWVFQFGFLWDFWAKSVSITPTVLFDVRDSKLATTFGLTFGPSF